MVHRPATLDEHEVSVILFMNDCTTVSACIHLPLLCVFLGVIVQVSVADMS